jgi:hypothetical protein
MFKKKECYLCEGKLIDGRCSSCGLDNTKLEKKNYRLNESSFDRKKKMTYSAIFNSYLIGYFFSFIAIFISTISSTISLDILIF